MRIRRIHLLQLLTILNCSWIATSEISDANVGQNTELTKAVEKLLDFEAKPASDRSSSRSQRKLDAASKYMQKLFELYSTDKNYGGDGAIVRSVNPTIEVLRNKETITFGIGAIKQSEQVIRAELHFNTRHKSPSSKTKSRKFLRVIGLTSSEDLSINLAANRDGWLGFDATPVVLDARYTNNTIVRIQVYRRERILKANDAVKKYTPFLLVYSKPTEGTAEQDFVSAMKEDEMQKGSKKRSKRSSDYYAYTDKKSKQSEDDALQLRLKHFIKAGPSILRNKKKSSKQDGGRRKSSYYDKNDPMKGFGRQVDTPIGNDDGPLPTEKGDGLAMILLDNVHTTEKCGKRRMTVNFEDIGWGEYIVQPLSFEANYCSGTCSFRVDKYTNSHAIFQSLIHTTGLDPYVPNVCCAPDKFDSQTLLYFQGENLVLRTFPRMIVTSCACN